MSLTTSGIARRPVPGGPGSDEPGPTAARLRLGAQLRQLRAAAGLTRAEAAARIRASAPKISRMELGRTGVKQRDLGDLLDLYGLTGGPRRTDLLTLARQASTPGWWTQYRDAVPPWFDHYLGLEQAAGLIQAYDMQFIPGLLQTEEYARAVFRLAGHLSERQVEQRVRLRLERQRILQRSDPPRLWVILDEAVLRRPVGGAEVMRAQLRQLDEAAERRYVTIQVLPLRAGCQPAYGRPFSVLRFPGGDIPDVVYLELLDRALYLSKPGDLGYYGDVLAHLAAEADPPIASALMFRHLQPGG